MFFGSLERLSGHLKSLSGHLIGSERLKLEKKVRLKSLFNCEMSKPEKGGMFDLILKSVSWLSEESSRNRCVKTLCDSCFPNVTSVGLHTAFQHTSAPSTQKHVRMVEKMFLRSRPDFW